MPLAPTPRLTDRIEVRIDRRSWTRFKAMCAECNVTISDGVRQAVDDLYDRWERGQL